MGREHGLTGRARDPLRREEVVALEEVAGGRPWSISRGIPGHSGSFQLIPAQESQRPESQAAWKALASHPHRCLSED